VDDKTSEDLVGLVVLARKQQALAQTAVESLAATSVGLEKQLFGLRATIPAVQEAAERGAQQASGKAFVGVAEAAAKAMDAASQPSIARLEKTIQTAAALEEQLRRVVAWFAWRLAARLAAVFGAGVLVLWLLGWVSISRFQDERATLAAEIEQLRAQATRLKVVDCEQHGGPKGRKCLPVDLGNLYGDEKAKTLYYPVW
jgi:hypothetical protein